MSEPAPVVTCLWCGWVSTVPQGLGVPLDGTEAAGRCWRRGGRRFRAVEPDDAPPGATLNDLLADE